MAMHSNTIALATKSVDAEIAFDGYPYLRTYKDGRIERLAVSTFVPASDEPGATGVATRDVVIDLGTGVSVRLFLNVAAAATGSRLPIIVYFHGGAFCTGSAFSKLFHRYAASLSTRAGALVVSVDYRLVPEHPILAAYDDAWEALQWVASLSDPWLANHADPMRMFLAGESAGANIVHNVASRAMAPDGDDIDINGLILLQPFFWGTERLPAEMDWSNGPVFAPERLDTLWSFLTAGVADNDDPRLNPQADEVARLPCRRALVSVATKDVMGDRGRRYAALLRHGEWCREVTLVESEGEDHAFHLVRPRRATAVALMDRVVEFVNASAAPPISNPKAEHLPMREGTNGTCRAMMTSGSGKKVCGLPRTMARNALVVGPAKTPAASFVLLGLTSSSKLVHKGLFTRGVGVQRRIVAKSFPLLA
ncbi:hypothetical protein ACP70R_004347 [Stipagrostis hirtigluma subsp. patula]